MKVPSIDTMSWFLLFIGGLNAGINAVFSYDVIGRILGANSTAGTVLYALVGMAALYAFVDRMGWMGDEA